MKIFLFFTILILSNLEVFAQKFTANLNDYSSKLIEYSPGIFYIVGTSKSYSDNYADKILVIKINTKTAEVVTKTFGGKYANRGYGINKLNDGNLIVTGETWEGFIKYGIFNAFLLNLDTNLNENFAKEYYVTARDAGLTCKELKNGDILIVGYTRSYNTAPQSIGDIFVIRTNAQGDTLWKKAFNSAGNDFGFDALELDNGNLLILGTSGGFFNSNQADYRIVHDSDILLLELDSQGHELNRYYYGGDGHELANKIIKAPDNSGFYIIGSTQSYGNGNFDILLSKIDNNFNEIFHKTYGTSKIEYGNSICLSDDKQNLVIATTIANDNKMPVGNIIFTDLDGNEVWNKKFSFDTLTFLSDIVPASDGGYAFTGYCGNKFDNYDIFFSKIDSEGNLKRVNIPYKVVRAYPNPVQKSEKLNFRIYRKNDFANDRPYYYFYITNEQGKIIYSIRSDNDILSVDANWAQGIYFYEFIFDYKSISFGKFIVVE